MKDFAVKITVRNNRILKAMKDRGIKNCRQLAELAFCSHAEVVYLVALKRRPITKMGDWTQPAFGISAALDIEPEELWPDYMQHIKVSENVIKFEADMEEVQRLSSEPSHLDKMVVNGLIERAKLSSREMDILNRRFGLDGQPYETYEEIAKSWKVQRERIRQIECKAIRKLKHPFVTKNLPDSAFL